MMLNPALLWTILKIIWGLCTTCTPDFFSSLDFIDYGSDLYHLQLYIIRFLRKFCGQQCNSGARLWINTVDMPFFRGPRTWDCVLLLWRYLVQTLNYYLPWLCWTTIITTTSLLHFRGRCTACIVNFKSSRRLDYRIEHHLKIFVFHEANLQFSSEFHSQLDKKKLLWYLHL